MEWAGVGGAGAGPGGLVGGAIRGRDQAKWVGLQVVGGASGIIRLGRHFPDENRLRVCADH